MRGLYRLGSAGALAVTAATGLVVSGYVLSAQPALAKGKASYSKEFTAAAKPVQDKVKELEKQRDGGDAAGAKAGANATLPLLDAAMAAVSTDLDKLAAGQFAFSLGGMNDDPALRQKMAEAARDEIDHLAWTQQRLEALGARPSLLNPLWYTGAFAIGLLAGRAGDATSLGFVVETERQVEEHLAGHMKRLPAADTASRAVVRQMKADEARHADQALAAGAHTLPAPLRWAMRAAARVMTTTAHRI